MAGNIRLLQCLVCKSLEILSDFEGDPRNDTLLATLVSKHKFPSGDPHKGHLHRIEEKHWDNQTTRQQIIAQIKDSSGHTGLDPSFYNAKNTFLDDAMACWKRHNRTVDCDEYMGDHKRIVPDTKSDWKAAGITRPKKTPYDQYLCTYCPFHRVAVELQKKRK